MKKLNILILYKNKKTKIINSKKIKSETLMDRNIKIIFIPLYDNPNAYIPIKPSTLYDFKKAKISIKYQAFIYDYEDELGTSFDLQEFNLDCDNIIDFINGIYNCYKFRGVTIYLENAYQITSNQISNFVITPRHINIVLYDKSNSIITEIDSGLMGDLADCDPIVFRQTPAAYVCEDRMHCLKDILYVPEDIGEGFVDIENLPLCIHLADDNSWKKIRKPGKDLMLNDYILYKISDFEIYYLMEYGLYLELLKFREFDINYLSIPIDTSVFDNDYLESLDKNMPPTNIEKDELVYFFFSGDIFSIINACETVRCADSFIQSLIFFNTIMNYIKYYGEYCYSSGNFIKMRTVAIFCRSYACGEFMDEIVLSDAELTYDNINNAFLKMIMKGR